MGSLYRIHHSFFKGGGSLEQQIPLINLVVVCGVGGEWALHVGEQLVHNYSRCGFPGGQNKENEVRGEDWVQTVKDTGQVLFKHVNTYVCIA